MRASSARRQRWGRISPYEPSSRAVKPSPRKEENELSNSDIDELDSSSEESPPEISPAPTLTRRTAKCYVLSSPRKPDRLRKASAPENETIYAGLDRECRARCRILAKEHGWTTHEISIAVGSSVPSVSRTIRNDQKALDTIALDEQYVDKVKLKEMLDSKKGVDWEARRKHRRKAKPIGQPQKRARVSKSTPADPENDETSSASPSREASVEPPKKALRPPAKRPLISPDVDESDEEVVQSEDHRQAGPPEELVGPKTVLQPPNSTAISVKDKNAWPPVSIQSQAAAEHNAVLQVGVPQDRIEPKANTNRPRGEPHFVAERETPKPVLMTMHASRLPPYGRIGDMNPTVGGNINIASKSAPEFEKKGSQQDKSDLWPVSVPQDRAELKANTSTSTNHARGDPRSVAGRALRLPPPGSIHMNPMVIGNMAYGPVPEVSEKKELQRDKSNLNWSSVPAPVPDAPPAALPRGAGAEIHNTDGPAHLTKFLASLEIDLSRHLDLFLANDIACVADLAQYCGFREANLRRRLQEMFFDPFRRAEVRNLKRKRDAESEAGFEWEGVRDVGGMLRDDCEGFKQAEIYALIHGIGVLKQRRLKEQNTWAIPATKY